MTNETATAPPLVTGLDVVGRGLYLRPHNPYQLTRLLFPHANFHSFQSRETGQCYEVPEGYAINDSPPMPAQQSVNQLMIEESFDRFESQLKVDTSLAAGNALFSIDANASQAKRLRTSEDAYYALRSSFIPLWSVYLCDTTNVSQDTFDLSDVPAPFDHDHRKKYDAFFDRYGTHFVKRAWIGGKANLAFNVLKSSSMTKEDIQAGIKASFGTLGGGGASTSMQEAKKKLQSNAECTVWGKGGDELKLAALSSMDEARYNEWLATIKQNPQVIELEVGGIWTLLHDRKKADALLEAYKAATAFKPLSAIFEFDRNVYFLRGSRYTIYDVEKGASGKPRRLYEDWPFLAKIGFDRVDAAFSAGPFYSQAKEDLRRKFYVFRKNKYLRVDFDKAKDAANLVADTKATLADILKARLGDDIKARIPADVAADGMAQFAADIAASIEAKLAVDIEPSDLTDLQVAFGDELFDEVIDKVIDKMFEKKFFDKVIDQGYPKKISDGFPDVNFDRIDAVLNTGNGEIYFFSGNQFIRFNIANNRADEGYPDLIKKRWVGLTFDRIDAVIYWGNGKAYFFKDDQHIRYDMALYRTDPGYPKAIIGSYVEDWKFFE